MEYLTRSSCTFGTRTETGLTRTGSATSARIPLRTHKMEVGRSTEAGLQGKSTPVNWFNEAMQMSSFDGEKSVALAELSLVDKPDYLIGSN